MAQGRTGWMDKERGEVRRGIRKGGSKRVGTCVHVYVWRHMCT